MLENGYYWVIDLDSQEGPEIVRFENGMFWFTRSEFDDIKARVPTEEIKVLSNKLTEVIY